MIADTGRPGANVRSFSSAEFKAEASPIRLAPPLLPVARRRAFQTLGVALIAACSGDDLTGPSVADHLNGRRIAVAADNGKIAFGSERDGNHEVYVMNPDGTSETNLTNNPAIDMTPEWSPDGTKIAFASDRDGFPVLLDIFVMNADGTNPINLTNSVNTDLAPSWSPDGTKIAFHTFRDAGIGLQSEIYVMDADGSNQVNLTQNAAIDVFPKWSPDGTKIAFMRQVPFSSDAEIFVMDAATGANQTNITNNPASDGNASWSPDGSKIAFGSSRDDNFGEVYVMNADGSGVVRLTTEGGNGEPAWSPDGTKIVFATDRDGDLQIYAMDADGSNQVALTAPPGRNALPHWGVAPGTSGTCAEGVSEARSRIAQLFAGRPILRLVLNILLFRMQQAGFPNAEMNFGRLLDFTVQEGIITPQDAAGLKDLVSPC